MNRRAKLLFMCPLWIRRILFYGSSVKCPLCERRMGRFFRNAKRRKGKKCPFCGSLERHRVMAEYLRSEFRLSDRESLRILHFAPEPGIARIFQRAGPKEYVTADYLSADVDRKLDICAMDVADDSFDLVYCSHVLEHVADDRAAMRETFRVLSPGGDFLVMVPLHDGATVEDPEETDPAKRIERFGQRDHVRMYGMDIVGRLEEAGFAVQVIRPTEGSLGERFEEYGFRREDIVFRARKPGAPGN